MEEKATRRTSSGRYVGRAMPRIEDMRFLQGAGRYTDDLHSPGETHACFVRSPHPHARIRSIDVSAALAAPGVVAVLTGADYVAEGCGPFSDIPNPADALDHRHRVFTGTVFDAPHLPMPVERVVHLGEPVAVVIATSRVVAEDATDLVQVDYEPRDAVINVMDALDAPNDSSRIAVEQHFGDRAKTQAALGTAHIVVEQSFVNQRIVNAQMEPRSAIAYYDEVSGIYHMIAGSQGAQRQRDTLAAALRVPKERVEVICPDVGGGFGPRSALSLEQPVLAWASRKLGHPVRWTSTRSESFLSDYQGRDSVARAKLGLAADGRIVGYSIELTGNIGAYPMSFVPLANFYRVMTTVYDIPAAHVHIRGVLTNTVPTGPYRGAGRPEATYVLERLLDIAARRLGIDRIELRRRNLVRREQLPYRNAMGLTYDSGDFAGNMTRALEASDWLGFAARKVSARRRGRLTGIGIANYVESPVGAPHERVDVRVHPAGFVEVIVGTQSTGQGHETSFAQVMADQLGVTPAEIKFVSGDTRRVQSGGGTHSDRSMRLAGTLMVEGSAKIIAQTKRVAAHLLDVSADEVTFAEGAFGAPGSNRSVDLFEIARSIDEDESLPDSLRQPLAASAIFTGRMPAFPTGAAVCEVEIDPETGVTEITRYTSIDDVGQPINPLILHGQVHGGIAQGAGQALYETVVSDNATGQVLSGSFMDYAVPRADHFPEFDVELVEDPTSGNPLRVKGGGESGITPALAAVMNAVMNALAEFGIEHIDMPATPARIWEAIQASKR